MAQAIPPTEVMPIEAARMVAICMILHWLNSVPQPGLPPTTSPTSIESKLSVMLQKDKKTRKLLLGHEGRLKMRAACAFNAQLMDEIRQRIRPGITTLEIDNFVEQYTKDHGHEPATLGYLGYPKSCCTSLNDVICHGIPDETELCDGDIVNVDITSIVDGWHGDQSETFLIGSVSEDAVKVTQAAFDCMHLAIEALTPGCTVSVIGDTVVEEAHKRGLSVVREYVGHGLGEKLPPTTQHPPFPRSQIPSTKATPGNVLHR